MKDKYVILLDEYNFRFTVRIINHIVNLHNQGMHYKRIAKKIKCRQLEVLLVLLHVADLGEQEMVSVATQLIEMKKEAS